MSIDTYTLDAIKDAVDDLDSADLAVIIAYAANRLQVKVAPIPYDEARDVLKRIDAAVDRIATQTHAFAPRPRAITCWVCGRLPSDPVHP